MARVYRLAGGNGYAERVFVAGRNPSSRCTWMTTTTITPMNRSMMARYIREHRAAGLAVEIIGTTTRPGGLPYQTDTREPWSQRPGYGSEEVFHLRSGSYRIESIRCEYKTTEQGTTYRYTWAVTFLSEDGRRVEFTALDSRTRAEIIGSARMHESWGIAQVTRPRRLARPQRRA